MSKSKHIVASYQMMIALLQYGDPWGFRGSKYFMYLSFLTTLYIDFTLIYSQMRIKIKFKTYYFIKNIGHAYSSNIGTLIFLLQIRGRILNAYIRIKIIFYLVLYLQVRQFYSIYKILSANLKYLICKQPFFLNIVRKPQGNL